MRSLSVGTAIFRAGSLFIRVVGHNATFLVVRGCLLHALDKLTVINALMHRQLGGWSLGKSLAFPYDFNFYLSQFSKTSRVGE